jgi:hypothetical protein
LEKNKCGYKKETGGILVVLELFGILTMIVDTGYLPMIKLHKTKHTHKWVQMKVETSG